MADERTEYALKHSRKHDRELKYDFMPAMLEIIERPAHKAGASEKKSVKSQQTVIK